MLGWSLGGNVGLQIAANYSTAINKLVVTDTDVSGEHQLPEINMVVCLRHLLA